LFGYDIGVTGGVESFEEFQYKVREVPVRGREGFDGPRVMAAVRGSLCCDAV
jgi:hypothetical protein